MILPKKIREFQDNNTLERRGISSYINTSPIENFREPAACGYGYDDCEGSYNPNSGHSNFEYLFTQHSQRILGLKRNAIPIFNARFFLGYGINELNDFLALRNNLFHISFAPGNVANIFDYNYGVGSYQIKEIQERGNTKLLQIMEDTHDTLVPLHQKMRKEWKNIQDQKKAQILLIRTFGQELRCAQRDLLQRFQKVTEMLGECTGALIF